MPWELAWLLYSLWQSKGLDLRLFFRVAFEKKYLREAVCKKCYFTFTKITFLGDVGQDGPLCLAEPRLDHFCTGHVFVFISDVVKSVFLSSDYVFAVWTFDHSYLFHIKESIERVCNNTNFPSAVCLLTWIFCSQHGARVILRRVRGDEAAELRSNETLGWGSPAWTSGIENGVCGWSLSRTSAEMRICPRITPDILSHRIGGSIVDVRHGILWPFVFTLEYHSLHSWKSHDHRICFLPVLLRHDAKAMTTQPSQIGMLIAHSISNKAFSLNELFTREKPCNHIIELCPAPLLGSQ